MTLSIEYDMLLEASQYKHLKLFVHLCFKSVNVTGPFNWICCLLRYSLQIDTQIAVQCRTAIIHDTDQSHSGSCTYVILQKPMCTNSIMLSYFQH